MLGIIQSAEGLNRTKGWREGKFPSALSEPSIFSCPRTSVLPVLGLLDSDWHLHQQSPASQGFDLGLNYTTSSPGSPAHRWKIVRLPGLHNCGSQILSQVSSYMYLDMSYPFSLWGTLTNTGGSTWLYEEKWSRIRGWRQVVSRFCHTRSQDMAFYLKPGSVSRKLCVFRVVTWPLWAMKTVSSWYSGPFVDSQVPSPKKTLLAKFAFLWPEPLDSLASRVVPETPLAERGHSRSFCKWGAVYCAATFLHLCLLY